MCTLYVCVLVDSYAYNVYVGGSVCAEKLTCSLSTYRIWWLCLHVQMGTWTSRCKFMHVYISLKLEQLHTWSSHILSLMLPYKEILNVIASLEQSPAETHVQSIDE